MKTSKEKIKWPQAITRVTPHFTCGLMSDLDHHLVHCKHGRSLVNAWHPMPDLGTDTLNVITFQKCPDVNKDSCNLIKMYWDTVLIATKLNVSRYFSDTDTFLPTMAQCPYWGQVSLKSTKHKLILYCTEISLFPSSSCYLRSWIWKSSWHDVTEKWQRHFV